MNTNKQKAIEQFRYKIKEQIDLLKNVTSICGLGELSFFIHYLHFVRLLGNQIEVANSEKELITVYQLHLDDAYKYLIQCIFKNGYKKYIKLDGEQLINNELTIELTKSTIQLNKLYESLFFLSMFEEVEITGEREQNFKLDLQEINSKGVKEYFLYGARVDIDNNLKKSHPEVKEEFLEHFKKEYFEYKDLFYSEFQITLERFIEIVEYILNYLEAELRKNESHFAKKPNGNIDIQNGLTIIYFVHALFIPKNILIERFGDDAELFIDKLVFNPDLFNMDELKYNLIARQPIFKIEDHLLVSPEILLDSLFVNTHYTLLESESVSDEYKSRYGDKFVERLIEIGANFGYELQNKEVELYEGKNQIGDLDVVLLNKEQGHYLIIEAKNHALPLDVYFHDLDATKRRLTHLKENWEKKVERRYEHLDKNHHRYGIGDSYDYIIVTKSPEILSHFSDFLVLNENEFEEWLNNYKDIKENSMIFENIYQYGDLGLTDEQFESVIEDLMSGWNFEQ